MTTTDDSHPPATSARRRSAAPVRHDIGVRALVAGLAPVVMPLLIRHIEHASMALAFEGNASAVDERWATAGAGVMIIFKIDQAGQRQRVTVHGQLSARDADGIAVKLIALDAATVAALRSLVSEAQARSAGAAPPAARKAAAAQARAHTREQIQAAAAAAVKHHAEGPVAAFLDGLIVHLEQLRSGARTPAEHKKFDAWSAAFHQARGQLAHTLVGVIASNFAGFLHAAPQAHDDSSSELMAGGLSLMESTDLRASLAVSEAISRLANKVQASWHELAPQLAQLAHQKADDCVLSPALLCHQLRALLEADAHFSNWRQFDLSAGFTDAFASRIDQLYRTLGKLFESQGIHAPVRGTHGLR